MRKLLNTLYVTTPDAWLARDGETIVVREGDEERIRIPIHNLESVICYGRQGASPALMQMCAERDVALSFMSENGKFLARVVGAVSGNVLLRRQQYRLADSPADSTAYARGSIFGKVANSRSVLQRALRDHGAAHGMPGVREAVNRMADQLTRLESVGALDELRGVEGEAARTYFGVFNELIVCQKEDFVFDGRNRHPPRDRVNALLSFLYALLMNDVRSALEAVGLDPAVGFLHRDRSGRPGLALDMMEELRPYLADRLALTLINLQQVNSKGFDTRQPQGVQMDDNTRKAVIGAWQTRKREDITHPYLKEKIPIGLIPHVQALLLARTIRGDLDAYPAFLYK